MRWNVSRAIAMTMGLIAVSVTTARATPLFGTSSYANAGVACVYASPPPVDAETGPFSSSATNQEDGIVVSGQVCGPSPEDGAIEVAEASASADLTSGQLRAFAASDATILVSPPNATAAAFGMFTDTLTILPPGSGFSFSGTATLILVVHGSVEDFSQIYGKIQVNGMSGTTTVIQYCNEALVDIQGTDPCDLTVQMQVPFADTDPTFRFFMTLDAGSRGTGNAEAANTAQAGIILPPGYTFQSASGVFLTSPQPGSTPEPPSIVLSSVGLMALIWINRRVVIRQVALHGFGLQSPVPVDWTKILKLRVGPKRTVQIHQP